jgi:hypothetical protein
MNDRNANPELLANWMQAWTTLGRWQTLNARLSRDPAPLTSGWTHRSSPRFRQDAVADASALRPLQGW